MTQAQILKAQDFSEISEACPDAKNRITLKRRSKAGERYGRYRVYENSIGQIILDPLISIPASELWLRKNKSALSAVRRGIKQSAQGRIVKKRSLAKCAEDTIE